MVGGAVVGAGSSGRVRLMIVPCAERLERRGGMKIGSRRRKLMRKDSMAMYGYGSC